MVKDCAVGLEGLAVLWGGYVTGSAFLAKKPLFLSYAYNLRFLIGKKILSDHNIRFR